jgi:hypothetical protein
MIHLRTCKVSVALHTISIYVSDVSVPAVATTYQRLFDLTSGLDFTDEKMNKTAKPYLHPPVNRNLFNTQAGEHCSEHAGISYIHVLIQ